MGAGRKLLACVSMATAMACAAPAGASAFNLTHTFDTTRQGWEFAAAGMDDPATFSAASGNPPGSIRGTDTFADGSNDARFVAPAGFTGNYLPNIGGTVSFDLTTDAVISGGRTIWVGLVDTDGLPVGLIRQFIPVETSGAFHRYSAVLSPGNWELCSAFDSPPCPLATSGDFAAVLPDIDRVVVIVDIVDGTGETYFLDNFAVAEPPPAPVAVSSAAAATTPAAPAATSKCPKGKKLVRKKGKRRCVRKRKR